MDSLAEGWRLLGAETLCDTPHLRVDREFVATPTRPEGVHWMVALRKTAAVVAPRTPAGDYLLVRQERIAVRQAIWEFPAGQVDGEVTEASIIETAHRELGEETGTVTRGELIPLGHYYPSPGFTTECGHLFLATDVEPRAEGMTLDEHEAILEVRAFSPSQLRQMIADGEIIDANTQVVFARLVARGLLS